MNDDSRSAPIRILVVEDEWIVAVDLESQLQGLGYEVIGIAGTGRDALRLCETTQPDIVLMDVSLPGGMDGLMTAHEVKRLWDIPVIAVTALSRDVVAGRAESLSLSGIVQKPYRLRDLKAVISDALQRRAAA